MLFYTYILIQILILATLYVLYNHILVEIQNFIIFNALCFYALFPKCINKFGVRR